MNAGVFIVTAAICFITCACGAKQSEEPGKTGRYEGAEVNLPETGGEYTGLVQDGNTIRLVKAGGKDLLSLDGGETFEEAEIPLVYNKWKNWTSQEVVSPNGARLFNGRENTEPFNMSGYYLIAEDGQEILLEDIEWETVGTVCYGSGYFYCRAGDPYRIYRVDPVTGELRFLVEGYYPYTMAASDKMLYLQCYDRIVFYDLEKGEVSAEQDEVLDTFVREKQQAGILEQGDPFWYPYRDGGYVLTRDGLYWHTVFGDDMELVIDGAMSGMDRPGAKFLGMAIVEKEETPDFLVLYSDGSLVRYSYDSSLPAEPESLLRVYSLYEDSNIRRMVGAFRQAYPELYVRYETGTGLEYGATKEDALKVLATELASGEGPDIIVADEIPLRSYVEKGVFLELSEIRAGMTEGEYFLEVIDGLKYNDKFYVMPVSFAVPVIVGDAEKLKALETLEELADLLEKERAAGAEGSLIGVWNADDTLRLLAQSGQGAWMKEDGTLDRESVETFLVQAKRIYDAQMQDQEENAWGTSASWAGGGSALDRRFVTMGINPAYAAARFAADDGQPFVGGFIGIDANETEFPSWCAYLGYMGADYVLMPGQEYGACLAESLMAVNQASGHREDALRFLEYALSAEGQQAAGVNGVPVNRQAYTAGWKDPRGAGQENMLYSGDIIRDDIFIEIDWPKENEFKKLDSLIARISGVGYCDGRIYDAVVEMGAAALDGRCSIEEALDEIEGRVKLYLDE